MAFQPERAFITKPGVAALRRTPGKKKEISPNPVGVHGVCGRFPSVRNCHGDPRALLCNPYRFASPGSSRWSLQGLSHNRLVPEQEFWVRDELGRQDLSKSLTAPVDQPTGVHIGLRPMRCLAYGG
jgi:hypothetical protein